MKSTVFPLSPLQLELLRVYSFEPDESELLEIKSMLESILRKDLLNSPMKPFAPKIFPNKN
jgi:hypothetical protein